MLALYVATTSANENGVWDAHVYDGTECVYVGNGVPESRISAALAYHWPAVKRGGFWSTVLPAGRMRPDSLPR